MENKDKEIILDESLKEKRKYNSTKRKKIMNRLSKIKNKIILKDILKIVKKDIGNNLSKNKNGIFFDMNKLKDNSVLEISNIIDKELEKEVLSSESEVKLSYTPYSIDNSVENMGHRFSNKEKNLLKNFNYNKDS